MKSNGINNLISNGYKDVLKFYFLTLHSLKFDLDSLLTESWKAVSLN